MIEKIIEYLNRRLTVIDKEYGEVDYYNFSKHFAATMVAAKEIDELNKYIEYLKIVSKLVPSNQKEN